MNKYTYRPERLDDSRLINPMIWQIQEHAQLQHQADWEDGGFSDRLSHISTAMVRIIIEAAMIEYPELFTAETEV